jgi:hypothetical protein
MIISVLVFLPRFAVLTILWYVGVKYLVATIQLEELILNAVALEVILHVDEMLYDIFVPAPSKMVLQKTHPMPRPNWGPKSGRAQPFLKVLLMAVLLLLVRFAMLGPVIDNLEEVARVMCDGDQLFLAGELNNGVMFVGAPTRDIQIDADGYQYAAILQKTQLKESGLLSQPLISMDADSGTAPVFPIPDVKTATDYTTTSIGDFMLKAGSSTMLVDCMPDLYWTLALDPMGTNAANAINSALHYEFKDLNPPLANPVGTNRTAMGAALASHCAAFETTRKCYLRSRQGVIARFFCPFTCGLYSPISGNAFNDPADGVPYMCDWINKFSLLNLYYNYLIPGLPQYGGTPGPLQCTDIPSSSGAWANYAQSYVEYWTPTLEFLVAPDSLQSSKKALTDGLTSGCGFLASNLQIFSPVLGINISFSPVQMCDPELMESLGVRLRSMAYLCPVSCGCGSTIRSKYKKANLPWDMELGLKVQCVESCFNYTVV